MVDGVIDLCDDIAGARRIRRLQIMKSRGSRSIGGYHQYAIRSDGISIYPRLESRQGLQADDPAGGIKRLFLDGLGGFERAGAERTRFVEFFAALTNELRQLGVTTIATWEMRTLFGPALEAPSPEISALLDNLILLRQVEVRSRMLRAVAVLKMRDSDHDPRLHKFSIGRGGIEIVGPFEAADDAITGLARPEGR